MIKDILNFFDGGSGNQAQDINKQMVEEARNIPLPVLKEFYPELYKQVVSLNPDMEQAVNLGPSEMAGVSTDPGLRQAQLNALNKLSGIGEAGGRDAQFLADQGRLESDINSSTQGRMGAIDQNMAMRGISGGGSELVAKNIAAQQAANRQAQMGMDAKAQSEQRALQALMQSGQLAGQMQGQDFNQQSAKAQAADSISRFNAANTQSVQQRNVGARNTAQAANAQGAQNTANQNTGAKNQAQQYNLNLAQQQYDNEMKKRGMVAGAQQNLSNSYQNESNTARQFAGGMISAGAQYASGGATKKKEE